MGPMKRGKIEYVVDGYNLIHCLFPDGKKTSLEEMRKKTEALLLAFQKEQRCSVTIVYDGKECFRELASGTSLHIVFTPASKSADRWIIDYVKSLNTKIKLVTIVSTDNEIRRDATAFGAQCIRSEDFAKLLKSRSTSRNNENKRGFYLQGKENKAIDAEVLCEHEIALWKKLFIKGKL
jgi:uncharacterized protein